jgi:hypothetical protein
VSYQNIEKLLYKKTAAIFTAAVFIPFLTFYRLVVPVVPVVLPIEACLEDSILEEDPEPECPTRN